MSERKLQNFVDGAYLAPTSASSFAGAARNLEGKSAGEYLKDHTSFIRREPIGVVGRVTPWNYPLNMAV